MPECQYCDASFDSEEAYLEHLETEHPDDLGPIDRKRLGIDPINDDDAEDGISSGVVVLALIIGVAVVVAGGVVLLTSGGDSGSTVDAAQQPTDVGSAHYHGTMEVIITGDRIDFSQDRYQLQADAFHFEAGNGRRWHVHAQGVTLEFALATLGIDVTESSVTYGGTTYRDSSSSYSVRITVNGDSVTPSEYVLQPEDTVRIVVETA